jgi:hypothetical protein
MAAEIEEEVAAESESTQKARCHPTRPGPSHQSPVSGRSRSRDQVEPTGETPTQPTSRSRSEEKRSRGRPMPGQTRLKSDRRVREGEERGAGQAAAARPAEPAEWQSLSAGSSRGGPTQAVGMPTCRFRLRASAPCDARLAVQ